jgi:4a-hydroxytetrahydrobiopterin dehydratase
MPPLPDAEIEDGLASLGGWAREGDAIKRSFELRSFPEAIAFVNRVAKLAEDADHHPDIDIRWRTVHLTLSTHSEGGITAKDLTLAGEIDGAAPNDS